VLEKVKPLLRGNGGPIIMVQVTFTYENKEIVKSDNYGSGLKRKS